MSDLKNNFRLDKEYDLKTYLEVSNQCRIYYYKNGLSFYFKVLDIISYSDKDKWNSINTGVNCICSGIGTFDGIRHIYYGTEQDHQSGYIYYPNFNLLNNINKKLIKLEKMLSKKYEE
jgi:hypothetical protein